MKTAKMFPITLMATWIGSDVAAETVLAGKALQESPYYTGTAGAAVTSRRSLADWLQYRKDRDLAEDNAIARRVFVIDDPIVLEDLHALANRLLANWPGTVPEIAIFLKNGSPYAYGGEVTGANEVLMEIGTLSKAKSYDEVAAVLAHELSHVLLGHNVTDQYIKQAQSVAQELADVQSWSKGLDALDVISTGDTVTLSVDPRYQTDRLKIRKQEELANRFYRAVHASVFSRGNEKDADRLAADLLVAAGFSPAGIVESFDELAAAHTFTESLAVSMKDAASRTRDELEKYAAGRLDDADDLATTGLEAGIEDVRNILKGQVTATIVDLLESRHPVPDSRRADFLEYLGSEYNVLQRNKAVQAEPLTALRANPQVARLLERNRLAMEAFERSLDDPLGATSLLDQARADEPVGDSFTGYVAYNVHAMLAANEQAVGAIDAIDSFLHLTDASTVEMADFLLAGAADERLLSLADDIIAQKETYFRLVPEFYPAKIALARQRGDADLARRLANDCVEDYAERDELHSRCLPFADAVDEATDKRRPLDALRKVPRIFGR